jgi:hypothetical protein
MEIFFSRYILRPKRKANHSSNLDPRIGVILRSSKSDYEMADYFPHENFGDQAVERFLENFPSPDNLHHQSILKQLYTKRTPLPLVPFLNHQLWIEGSKVESPVIKIKLMNIDDPLSTKVLESNCRMRLDANGIFKDNELLKFLSRLNIQQISRIEYIEDPMKTLNWENIPIPTARDFINGSPFQEMIYKPNRCHYPNLYRDSIFSGYMGGPLGTIQTYKELIQRGNLKLYHGLLTPDLYENEDQLFQGNYIEGFTPMAKACAQYMERIQDQAWNHLCSI